MCCPVSRRRPTRTTKWGDDPYACVCARVWKARVHSISTGFLKSTYQNMSETKEQIQIQLIIWLEERLFFLLLQRYIRDLCFRLCCSLSSLCVILFIFYKKHYLFIWLHLVLVAAYGIQFPDQESNLGPLPWELRVLATGPPGKSLCVILNATLREFRSHSDV